MIVMYFPYDFIISALELEVFCFVAECSGGQANGINEDFAVQGRIYLFTVPVISALQEMCVLE